MPQLVAQSREESLLLGAQSRSKRVLTVLTVLITFLGFEERLAATETASCEKQSARETARQRLSARGVRRDVGWRLARCASKPTPTMRHRRGDRRAGTDRE